MARIPSAEDLGIRQSRAPTVSTKTPTINMSSDMAAVQTPEAKKGLEEMEQRIGNEELAKAEVQFQIASLKEANTFDEDTDLDTVEERHAAAMEDQLGKAAVNITSAKTRALFMIRGEEGVARAKQAMSTKITAKKNDREKGYMANAIDLMVKGGMNLEHGDPGEAALGIQLSLDSMVERNVISRVDAESTLRKAQLDMAYGRLKAMDPAQQLEILNSDDPGVQAWLDNVPPDAIRQLKEQAAAADLDNVAQDYAMSTRGMEPADAMNEMYAQADKEDWDAKQVDQTRLRIMRIHQDDEVMRQKSLEDYFEEGAASIYAGETTLQQLESTPGGIDMLKKLSEGQRRNLVAAQDNALERQAGRGRKYSDQTVKNQLKQYMANGQAIQGRKYWSENYAKLNDADFKYFNVATSPTKSTAPEFKPIQSTRQVMDDYLTKHPLDEEGEGQLWENLNQMAMEYFNDNQGKNPPKQMMQEWVEEMHSNVVLTPDDKKFLWIEYGGEQMLARDLPDDERQKYFEVTDVYKQAGFKPSVGTLKFNSWTEEERNDFRTIRRRYPDEDPRMFVKKFQHKIELDRANNAQPEPQVKRGFRGSVIQ